MKLKSLLVATLLVTALFSCRKTRLNKVPVADAGPAINGLYTGDTATLHGSGTDVDGFITAYLWSEISGPNTPVIETPGSATTKVTGLVAGKYYFQLMVVDDDGATGVDTMSVTIQPLNTLTLQPGPDDGQDALVFTREGDAGSPNANLGLATNITYEQWTYNAQGYGQGTTRSYLKFVGLSVIPSNATILSARLSLYGLSSDPYSPQGNSHYPGSPYYGYAPDNLGWLQRVTGNWNEATITWNNQPAATTTGELSLPTTTSQWNCNLTDLDVTDLVKTMVSTNSNYGFRFILQNENIYRSAIYGSSDNTDATRRPKLVVVYK